MNEQAAYLAQAHITRDYGGLEDLPSDLADMIASMYYRFYIRGFESKVPHFIPQEVKESGDLKAGMLSYIADASKCIGFVESGPDIVTSLRKVREQEGADLFEYAAQYLVDQWDYEIDNAGHKTGPQRAIERVLHRNRARRIEGLASKLREYEGNTPGG